MDVAVGGIDEAALARGQVLCWPSHPVPVAAKFKARITTLARLESEREGCSCSHTFIAPLAPPSPLAVPIVPGQQFTLHSHLLEEPCNVSRLLRTLDDDGHTKQARRKGGVVRQALIVQGANGTAHTTLQLFWYPHGVLLSQNKPRSITAGTTAVVRIRLLRRVPIELFADHRRMGRFVLRYGDRTVAAGIVVKISR